MRERYDKGQVLLFTRDFAVDWTNNISERGAKAVKRHQAVSGYWYSLATLARWCKIRSYLDSALSARRHRLSQITRSRTPVNGRPRTGNQSHQSLSEH